MENQEQKQPIGFAYKEDYVVEFSIKEFEVIDKMLQQFAIPLAIMNTKRDKAFVDKGIAPVFEEDVENGKIKNVEEFWKKHSVIPAAE